MLDSFNDLIQQIANKPLAALGVIVNLVLIESLLSVDNAAVLATMVMDLPKDQRPKALRYGLLGAYIFRGVCLLFAAALISIWWFKPLGGLYLLYLAIHYFLKKGRKKSDPDTELHDEVRAKKRSWLYMKTLGALGPFWATVVMVEGMDVAFSIDNVIAANAYSKNLILVWIGVFIGILAMRFASQGFVRMIERYSFLESCAYIVIAVLGIKLTLSGITHYYPCTKFTDFLEGHFECLRHRGITIEEGAHEIVWGDLITSIAGLAIFIVPIITSKLFNWPRHKAKLNVE